jgi:hypothetical protein
MKIVDVAIASLQGQQLQVSAQRQILAGLIIDLCQLADGRILGPLMPDAIAELLVLPLCQDMTFLTHVFEHFYSSNLNKRVVQLWFGSSFLRFIFTKSSELCQNFVFCCVPCEVAYSLCICN